MTLLTLQNIIVALSLFAFAFLVYSTASVYATSNSINSTNSTSVEQLNQQDLTITSKGCGEGYGYNVNDPSPICEPVDKIGEGPPKDMAFCAALGCPYNPPADSELPSETDGGNSNNNDNDFATTPVAPTPEVPAVGPGPEPDTNDNEDTDSGDSSDDESSGGDDSEEE